MRMHFSIFDLLVFSQRVTRRIHKKISKRGGREAFQL